MAFAPAAQVVRLTQSTANLVRPGVTRRRESGASPGINIEPGHDDDGWIVPPPVTLVDGSRIQLYKDGEALHAAFEAIKKATRRICLEVYIFASDDTGRAFADLLCKKAREGVRVYVIYDSFGSVNSDHKMFANMWRAGVNICVFHPIRPWRAAFSWRPLNRDHRKLLFIDDEIAGMGGLNVGGEYAGSWIVPSQTPCCEFWRDSAIGIQGPAARVLLRSFAQTWHYVNTGGRINKAELIHNIDLGPRPRTRRSRRSSIGGDAMQSKGEGTFGLFASVPTLTSPLNTFLTKLIRSAHKSIQLTMAYFAPSDTFINELCAAAKRGVKVQLMLPGRCDVPLLLVAARSFYETLLAAGIQIFEREHVILHSKTLVIDSYTSVVGSTNLDYRSTEFNCELSAIIRSSEFGKQMSGLFQNDTHFATRIFANEWRRRPWRDRAIQSIVNRVRYLL